MIDAAYVIDTLREELNKLYVKMDDTHQPVERVSLDNLFVSKERSKPSAYSRIVNHVDNFKQTLMTDAIVVGRPTIALAYNHHTVMEFSIELYVSTMPEAQVTLFD